MNREHVAMLVGCLCLAGCTQPVPTAAPASTAQTAQPTVADAAINRWDALRPDEVTYQRPPPQIGL
ncbi:hypothetical protein [Listeria seeligeri]|nr:hypothetical protein [Listeria seeligeri]